MIQITSPSPLVLEVDECRGFVVLFLLFGGGQVDLFELVLVAGVLVGDCDGSRRILGERHPVPSHATVLLFGILVSSPVSTVFMYVR